MQTKSSFQFEAALSDFNTLKNNSEIPPQMLIKLEYLLHKIYPIYKQSQQQQTSLQNLSSLQKQPFSQLPQYQKNSLDQISVETGIQLFINIINCLSGKDVITYVHNQKMYIRKDQALTMWSLCYGCIDNNRIVVYKKPVAGNSMTQTTNNVNGKKDSKDQKQSKDKKKDKPLYQLELENLRVSKNFKDYKRKSVFGVCYKRKNSYLIGFDQESACARMHQLIRNLVKQKLKKKAIQLNENTNGIQQPKTTIPNSSIDSSRVTYDGRFNRQSYENANSSSTKQQKIMDESFEAQKSQYQNGNEQDDMQNLSNTKQQQNEHKTAVLQYIRKEQLLCDQSFKLLRNDQQIRQLVHKRYPNIIKQVIILDTKNMSISEGEDDKKYAEIIMQAYLRQNQWNQQIENLQVNKKLSVNLYSVILKTKKYSYMSYPRNSQIFAMGLIYNGIKYLVMRSSDDDSNLANDSVKMEWNQIVEIRQNGMKILITVLSQFDFKGYASIQDSQKMGLKLMKGLEKFGKYVQTQMLCHKDVQMFKLEQPAQKKPKQRKMKKIPQLRQSFDMSTGQQQEHRMRKFSDANSEDSFFGSQVNASSSLSQKNAKKKSSGEYQKLLDKSTPTFSTTKKEYKDFLSLMLKTDIQIPSDQLILAIRNKDHEKYYLKHKFDERFELDLNRHVHQVVTIDNYINQGGFFTIRENGDVVFYDEKIIEIQKGILKMILKQLSSNIISGKSIMNMSLPVQIFDNKSILQRIAMGFGYFPRYLTQAGDTQDIVKQAELVTLGFMGILPLHLNVQKPFNPILGQTFQCYIGGIPIFLEQVSHHPPITAVYIKGDNFIVHGLFHSHAEMGLNQVHGRNLCPLFAQFPLTNTFYQMRMNDMQVTGIMYGDRMYRGIGKSCIYEKTNNTYIQFSFGKDKKKVYQMPKGQKMNANTVIGGIYTVTQNFGKRYMTCQNKKKFQGLKPDQIVSKHTQIKGHWALDMYFNGIKVKSMTDPIPNKVQYPQYVLPSDSTFRLDLLYKRMDNLKVANEQKQVLQNIQRNDRKLRGQK